MESPGSGTPHVSVVIPVYRAVDCLRPLHQRLVAVLEALAVSFELVLVEDCGGDGSWEVLEQIAAEDDRVRAVQLSRNFGQHAAITAGLELARGDWTVLMDCDLQDPPEEIPRLLQAAEVEGVPVVLVRRNHPRRSLLNKLGVRLYARLMRTFGDASIDGDYGTFSLISRGVREDFLKLTDVRRHYLLVLFWMGHPSTSIEIQREERHAGESSYGFTKLVSHAIDGVFFQTTVLLRWIVYLGFAISLVGFAAVAWVIASRIIHGAAPGWTSLITVVLLMGGFTITSLGVVGLYLGAVFDQTRRRPVYLIARRAGAEQATHSLQSDGTAESRGQEFATQR